MTEHHIDDGGAAFPKPNCDELHAELGMSLRDWFAGQTLAGMIAENEWYTQSTTTVAMRAYQLADAMIAARKLEKTND